MRVESSYKLILLGVAATLLAIIAHGLLPDKRMQVYPGGNIEGMASVIYADDVSGGNTTVSWIDQEQLHWRCDVREGPTDRYCGFHLDFTGGDQNGLNLSGYTAARVKLSTRTSDSRIRIAMRNFEQGFSVPGNIDSAKFNNVLIPVTELREELTVSLQEFSVAEWWINQRNVPRKFSSPNFDNVLTVGIDLGVPPATGVHELKLERLEFVGEWVSAEEWYRGILFVWLVVIALAGLTRYVQIKRRLIQDRAMLEQLVSHNSKLKDESEKYRELSSLDNLTGALNRHGLDEVLAQLRSDLSAEDEVALLVLDLDHFKAINDKLGHDVGDKVLKQTADVIAANIRQSDTFARWGGEEFVVLCPRVGCDGARTLAEKLRNTVSAVRFASQPELQITVSIGAGCFSIASDFDEAFKRVDKALYQAKNGGRDQVVMAEI